jgi:hypothetical protein
VEARFSAPVQTGPGAYPASYTMGSGSFPGVKRPGPGADHPPPHKRRGHERVGLYFYSPSGPQWPVIGRTFAFMTTSRSIDFRMKNVSDKICRENQNTHLFNIFRAVMSSFLYTVTVHCRATDGNIIQRSKYTI